MKRFNPIILALAVTLFTLVSANLFAQDVETGKASVILNEVTRDRGNSDPNESKRDNGEFDPTILPWNDDPDVVILPWNDDPDVVIQPLEPTDVFSKTLVWYKIINWSPDGLPVYADSFGNKLPDDYNRSNAIHIGTVNGCYSLMIGLR